MKPTLFNLISNALSVGTLLQNALFYFMLVMMAHIMLVQSRISRLRSSIAEDDIE
jgi:hypothetical protein